MPPPSDSRIDAVRRFNRFYTRQIGMLRGGLYDSPWSLAAARVLYELARADHPVAATALARDLGLDAGYLSRILRDFTARGYLRKSRPAGDARRFDLTLTAAGRKAFLPLDRASHGEIAALLTPLADDAQARLVDAMGTVEVLLGHRPANSSPFVLRPHRPGDIGWVISRHGALYAQEYGWDGTFEALVADIAARFIRRYKPGRECCWIAERDGVSVGSAFVVERSPTVAQLRLLIVEPAARGAGIGRRLVAECIGFARRCRYRKMMLWTNRGLDAARHLYEDAGFRLVAEEAHHSFGKDLVGQTFELGL
ncbi:MAG TPA: helix-turn-helix domain-containing GNAT family N-acetyltransferase [Casimicrobiaceae bacterium]|nr:helix-turn-helix domain-containing GNAT family N-acetyltransferase [Casimicrobiaceae bacterium]